ncbi:hypothetical protein AB0K00_13860 [Dactylosporangium sp. NPDC049525]
MTGPTGHGPDAATLEAARYQGRRLTQVTVRLHGAGHPAMAGRQA